MRKRYGPPLLLLLPASLCAAMAALSQNRPQQVPTSAEIRAVADTARELRVVVALEKRRMWVIGALGDTLRTAPVAVGSNRRLSVAGRSWYFTTPRGIRRVESTDIEPLWMRPDWAYIELARERKLKLDSIGPRNTRMLSDGRTLSMRGGIIGTSRDSADFVAWPVDRDIIVGGVLYMPPVGTAYRGVPGVLGRFRLNLGNSIGFHGTQDKQSIGRAVTHGCMRLHDEDVEWLYLNVPLGTRVFIY